MTEEEVWQEYYRKLKINSQPPPLNSIIRSLFDAYVQTGVQKQSRLVPFKNSNGLLHIDRFRWAAWTYIKVVPLARDRCELVPHWPGDTLRVKWGNTLVWAVTDNREDVHRVDRREEFLPLIKLSSPQAFWNQYNQKQKNAKEFLEDWAWENIHRIREGDL